MLTAIRNWVIRTMMKSKGETGIVKTLPKKEIVDINTQITAERLMQNGVDPRSLKNADQVENAIIAIENRKNVQTGFTTKKSADVFDLEGRKIDTSKGIMGGKQIDDLPPGDPDLPPPGSRGGPDDIAAPVQSAEESLRDMFIAENRKNLAKMKNRKMVKDAIDNMSPGFVKGDRKYNAQLVAEELAEKRFGKDFYDLDQKQQNDLYGEALDGLSVDLDKFAQGGRAEFANGSKGLLDLLDIQASGSKSGKQQIDKAPEGFTIDSETYNFIVNADIPINEKINLLTKYGRGKGRDKIEKDGQELFLGEGGSRIREIGLDINPDAERGFSGNIMYDPDSDNVKGGIKYKFADGGRIGYKLGGFKTILNFLNENNPVQAYKKYLQSVKTRAQENPKALVPELAAITSGGIFVNRRMQDILKNMKEKDMENNLENFKEELNKDPFYQKYPDIKDKVLENYTEKMFGEKRADGGRIGYFMGSANPRGLGLLRQLLNFFGKKSDVIKNPSDVLKVINPKAFNKMLEDAKGKVIPGEGIMATDRVKDYQTAMAKDRIEMVKDMIERGKRMKGADDKILAYKNDVKERFMKDLQMSEADAEIAADRMATLAMDVTKMEKTPAITEEGILQLENVLKNLETGGKKKRELNATGGRIGLKDGMDRRTFMKIMAGLTALPVLGKFFKGAKVASKAAPIIKTPNAPGKPEWFDALVTKVVNEGTDVTKGFATKERELVHTKQINDFAEVTVYRDLDTNTTIVNYGSKLRRDPTKPYEKGNIQRAVNDPDQVDLVVKGAEDVEPTIIENERGFVRRRGTKSSAEFEAYESEPRVVNYDGDMEFDGTNVVNDVDDLKEDVSVLKEYATGKKLTPEEAAKAKKKREDYQKFLEDPVEQANYLENKYGPGPEPDDYASGGIARMLGE